MPRKSTQWESLNVSTRGISFCNGFASQQGHACASLLSRCQKRSLTSPPSEWRCTGHVVHVQPNGASQGATCVGVGVFDCYEVLQPVRSSSESSPPSREFEGSPAIQELFSARLPPPLGLSNLVIFAKMLQYGAALSSVPSCRRTLPCVSRYMSLSTVAAFRKLKERQLFR